MKKVLILAVLGTLVLLAGGCAKKKDNAGGNELPQVNWKISHTQAPAHIMQLSAEKMAASVKEKTGGKFVIEVYHSGTLGAEQEVIENMQMGTIAGNFAAASLLANFVSCYNLFALPAMFTDVSQYQKIMQDKEIVGRMEDACLEAGIINYGYFQDIFRSLFSKKSMEKISDFTGQKIRVMGSPILVATYQALGCNPTTTAWGELFSALQLGVVDGLDHVAGSVKSMSFYENLDYVAKPNLFTSPMFFIISKKMYDELPKEYQAALDEAIETILYPELRREANKDEEEAFKFLTTEGGMQYIECDVPAIHRAVAPVREKYLAEMEPWVQEIGKSILARTN
ncbi:MAG: TRAP transporter substrate-binding protein [Spirochaetales bacterium]|jgi:tripartite ATP-independent transporter DctP family solute receptor|nr:TRAP transporter substrate-binding protein [Spirochaetales bacterium]